MLKEDYKKIVDRNIKKESSLKNALQSFFYGGLIGVSCEILFIIIKNLFNITNKSASKYTTLIIILASVVITSLGKFDKCIKRFRFGLIIPTTGFAHSISCSGVDYKKEGLITGIGSNFFKLAGSVILYSVFFAFIFVILKVITSA